jgi:hypothetical protein
VHGMAGTGVLWYSGERRLGQQVQLCCMVAAKVEEVALRMSGLPNGLVTMKLGFGGYMQKCN